MLGQTQRCCVGDRFLVSRTCHSGLLRPILCVDRNENARCWPGAFFSSCCLLIFFGEEFLVFEMLAQPKQHQIFRCRFECWLYWQTVSKILDVVAHLIDIDCGEVSLAICHRVLPCASSPAITAWSSWRRVETQR